MKEIRAVVFVDYVISTNYVDSIGCGEWAGFDSRHSYIGTDNEATTS